MPVAVPEAEVAPETDEVLALPQACDPTESADEPFTVLDVAPLNVAPTLDPAPVVEAHAPADAQSLSATLGADSLTDSGSFDMPKEYAPQFSRADVVRASEGNNYSLGVRLMRVSPLWLLACGLAFIGLVVLLNGLTGSAEQLGVAATRGHAPSNHATNQSTTTAPLDRTTHAQTEAAAATNKSARMSTNQQSDTASATQQSAQHPAPVQQAQAQPSPAVKPTPAPAREPQPAADGKFTLQVGSYNTPVEANERAAHLRAAGVAAQVVAVELPKRGTWYRVQTGRFADRAEAQRYGAQLRAQGAAESFIVTEVTDH
jgi:cell division septation protein DedD